MLWHLSSKPLGVYSNRQLIEAVLSARSRVIVLDGPSWCGKTFLLHELQRDGGQIIPFYRVVERLVDNLRKEDYSRQSFIMELMREGADHPIVCFDDIDLILMGKPETQIEIALLINTLADKRKIVLAGIEIADRCKNLMKYISYHCYCDYYRYVPPKG